MSTRISWQTRIQQRLQAFADQHFANWCKSKEGKKWKARKQRVSPYEGGFSLPDYHHELIEALNRNDEENAKYLVHVHYLN